MKFLYKVWFRGASESSAMHFEAIGIKEAKWLFALHHHLEPFTLAGIQATKVKS